MFVILVWVVCSVNRLDLVACAFWIVWLVIVYVGFAGMLCMRVLVLICWNFCLILCGVLGIIWFVLVGDWVCCCNCC